VTSLSGTILHYYAGGNTARGFHSLYESNLKDLQKLFILKGGPGTGKSSLMKALGRHWENQGYSLECLHCSSDNDSIDGVILTDFNIGIVDGTAPHVIEPKVPGVIEEYINLGEAWDEEKLNENKERIISLTEEVSSSFSNAYHTFSEALAIHDEWEKIFIENMDFEALDSLTVGLIEELYTSVRKDKIPKVRHRFLGAATPEGAKDCIPNLTADLQKRYLIKGRPGSGKSTMLKKLAGAAEERGLDVEIYHCGFDPNSLDMVIVRELGFAIFDSTSPHEYFPERVGDEVVDVYQIAIKEGTDEKYAKEISEISGRYSAKMKEGTAYLARAKELHDELEKYYVEAMNFDVVAKFKDKIQKHVESVVG
jgi:hypothetical protein